MCVFSHDYLEEWDAVSLTLSFWKCIQTNVGCPKNRFLSFATSKQGGNFY